MKALLAKLHLKEVNSGASHTNQTDVATCDPADPLTDDETIAKFRANAEGVMSAKQTDRIVEAAWNFESFERVDDSMRWLVAQ